MGIPHKQSGEKGERPRDHGQVHEPFLIALQTSKSKVKASKRRGHSCQMAQQRTVRRRALGRWGEHGRTVMTEHQISALGIRGFLGRFVWPDLLRSKKDRPTSGTSIVAAIITRRAPPGAPSPATIEGLLRSKEASQILKIHPKVLERMAKRGEVPALKVGKFWRYRATTLDAWINSRLE